MAICDKQRFNALNAAEREQWQFSADFGRAVLKKRPCNPEALAMAATALTTLGYYAEGLEYDRRLYALRPRDPLVVYNFACSLALTGATDEAFSRLEEAINLGYDDAQQLNRDPDWDKVRGFERFQELLLLAQNK